MLDGRLQDGFALLDRDRLAVDSQRDSVHIPPMISRTVLARPAGREAGRRPAFTSQAALEPPLDALSLAVPLCFTDHLDSDPTRA
jgi:hypothetical protein